MTMVSAGNKAIRLSSVNHFIKTTHQLINWRVRSGGVTISSLIHNIIKGDDVDASKIDSLF